MHFSWEVSLLLRGTCVAFCVHSILFLFFVSNAWGMSTKNFAVSPQTQKTRTWDQRVHAERRDVKLDWRQHWLPWRCVRASEPLVARGNIRLRWQWLRSNICFRISTCLTQCMDSAHKCWFLKRVKGVRGGPILEMRL